MFPLQLRVIVYRNHRRGSVAALFVCGIGNSQDLSLRSFSLYEHVGNNYTDHRNKADDDADNHVRAHHKHVHHAWRPADDALESKGGVMKEKSG